MPSNHGAFTPTGVGLWPQWNVTYTSNSITTYATNSAITTGAASNGSYVWTVWNANGTSGTIVTQQSVWPGWNDNYTTQVTQAITIAQAMPARAPTQEELRAGAAARALAERTYVANERKRAAEADRATRRARDLLMRHLSEEQRKDLEQKKCFYLESIAKNGERRRYRIDQGTHGNVKLLDKDGRIIGSYCVQPNGVPAEDAMLAQKLWLETNEEAFVKAANFRRHVA